MNKEEYFEWIDKEIKLCDHIIGQTFDTDIRSFLNGKKSALNDAKNQFAMFIATNENIVTNSSSTENNFTDGL